MNDNDDLDIDDIDNDDEFNDVEFEDKLVKKNISAKRDIRVEIEKRLEMMELRKLSGDSVYDELFD
jgi:hypothetical protein